MSNIEDNIKQSLKGHKKQHSACSSDGTNSLKIKFEYNEKLRAIQLNRPVAFDSLYNKISSNLGLLSGIRLYYIGHNKEIFGQIANQSDLEKIVKCIDNNDKYNCLRILVTSNPQQQRANSDATISNKYDTDPSRPNSPPPGCLHPNDQLHMERSPTFPTTVHGKFIPEDDSVSKSGDSSYSSGRQSLENNYHTSEMLSRFNMTPNNIGSMGTYPSRIQPHNITRANEGVRTLPHFRNSYLTSDIHYNSNDINISKLMISTGSSSNSSSASTNERSIIPSLDDYKKGPLLGRGGFGQVYKCMDSQTGSEFAMKEVLLCGINNDAIDKDVKFLENEINIYRGLMSHIRIVQYYGTKLAPDGMYIFMEYMAGGSVKDQLRQYGPLPHNIILRYSKQILQGLAFLHQNMIIHRDLKAANILRDTGGNIKLSDFGASKYLRSISVYSSSNGCKDNNDGGKEKVANSFCGTFFWMAPEVIRGEPYSISADIWSFGATLVEMLTKHPPYHNLEPYAALYKIANTNKIEFKPAEPMTTEMEMFVNQIFSSLPTERPSAEKMLQMKLMLCV